LNDTRVVLKSNNWASKFEGTDALNRHKKRCIEILLQLVYLLVEALLNRYKYCIF